MSRDRFSSAAAGVMVTLMWVLSAAGSAQDAPHFVPGGFGDGPRSLLRTIECPKAPDPENLVVVLCQAEIGASGETKDGKSYCVADGGRRTLYSAAANDAVDRAMFSPASVGGVATPVYVSFRLLFRGDGDRCAIAAIANAGGELPGATIDYIAPQEILSDRSWFWRAIDLQGPGGSGRVSRPPGVLFTLSVAVSADGHASDGRIEKNYGATRREARAAVSAIQEARFIPGFVGGQPRPMRYVEMLFVTSR